MPEQYAKDQCIAPEEIAVVARSLVLPPAILIACCATESSLDAGQLTRFEPNFRWFTPGNHTPEERRGQATSWGIGHVMGATLRELGYGGKFADLLTDHKQAAAWAGRYLKKCWLRAVKLEMWDPNLDDMNRARILRAVKLEMWDPNLDDMNRARILNRQRPVCTPEGALDYWEAAIGAYNTGGFTTFPQKHIERFRWWRERAHRFGFPE